MVLEMLCNQLYLISGCEVRHCLTMTGLGFAKPHKESKVNAWLRSNQLETSRTFTRTKSGADGQLIEPDFSRTHSRSMSAYGASVTQQLKLLAASRFNDVREVVGCWMGVRRYESEIVVGIVKTILRFLLHHMSSRTNFNRFL